jgi:hypothetical protein
MLRYLMTRLSLRFLLPLLAVLALVAYGALHIVDKLTLNWFRRDLDTRSHLILNATETALIPLLDNRSRVKIENLFTRMTRDARLYAVGFCDAGQRLSYRTLNLPDEVECRNAVKFSGDRGRILPFRTAPSISA